MFHETRSRLPHAAVTLVLVLVCGTPRAAAAEGAGKKIAIFDGRSLDGWKVTDFGGQGEVTIEEGAVQLPFGQDMTGITWNKKSPPVDMELPGEDYELNLDAMRVGGSDFFCGMTFLVGEEPCSLILGGWGGGVVGLSSIDGYDASENETTQYLEFEKKVWYHVRVRVTKTNVTAWIDDKQVIDVDRKDKKFSVRSEMELSRPLGFATWQTTGALKNISLTLLGAPAEVAAPPATGGEGSGARGAAPGAPAASIATNCGCVKRVSRRCRGRRRCGCR